MSRYRRKNSRAGRVSIACIVILLLIVMSVQIIELYHKDQDYIAREAELTEALEKEEASKEQLSEYEEYIGSREYVEDTAKSRLGLVYDNEIIFKEK